ncbi:DUF3265 domain-containing protein [Vibrio vulnificus]|nr:DUF3265 domain-containing protein [Vibrio vulnificus]MCG6287958.1 DUF3265 domain-containing protein [Vibrio vulnificus]MCU8335217.1 DUF3265 domain-containing protein [Vibrio vulnificus]MCU8413287.1 DUF3265 domain-containing protein [Vibrio vulnificus]
MQAYQQQFYLYSFHYLLYILVSTWVLVSNNGITRRSRGIHAAWHFWFAVSFVVKVVCGRLV